MPPSAAPLPKPPPGLGFREEGEGWEAHRLEEEAAGRRGLQERRSGGGRRSGGEGEGEKCVRQTLTSVYILRPSYRAEMGFLDFKMGQHYPRRAL